jgi:hypothetical protein
MSIYAPPSNNREPLIKFGEFEIWVEAKSGKSEYFIFTFVILPFDPAKQPVQRKIMSFGEDYQKVTWPSIEEQVKASNIKSPDDLFTAAGENPKKFYASYQTPLFLTPARANDIEWAKTNDRMGDFEVDQIGRPMKKNYPVKLVKVYPTKEVYEADASAAPSEVVTPAQPAAPSPEYQAVLAMLPIFVNNSGLDLHKLEVSLANPPLSTYFNINSPEVRHEVAKAVITKTGPTDENAIKGVLIGLNGGAYLDIESPEIKAMREGIPF